MKSPLVMISFLIFGLITVLGLGAAAAQTQEVDLPTYLQLVSENNLGLQAAKLELVQAELAFKKATAANLFTGSKQAALKAASDFAAAQATYEQTRAQIMRDAVASYFQVILAQRDLEIRQNRLKLAEERRAITERKIAEGLASELDLLQATAEVERAKLDYQRADQAYQEKLLDFNSRAGSGADLKYVPGVLPVYPIVKYDPETAVGKALAASDQLKRLSELARLAEMELAKAEAENAAPLTLEQAKNDLALAKIQVEQQRQALRASVLKDLHTLRSLEKEIALSQLNVELAQSKYKTAEKQYKAGLLTDRELDESVTGLWEARKQELQAKQNYAIQLLSFKGLIGEELE
ncbi:MAG: TolC family protein [Firmicutes bacterium]|nr:TolC family protein [Bacillota bacterium]